MPTPRAVRWLVWVLVACAPATAQTPAPVVRDLHATRVEATWLVLQWTGPPGTYEVSYRQRNWTRDRWLTFGNIPRQTYSAVGLQPDTAYDFRVRYVDPQHDVPAAPKPPKPLTITTASRDARVVGALRLWPPQHLNTFPAGQTTPWIVTWGDSLYVLEGHEGGLFLSKVRPADLVPLWTKPLLPPPTAPAVQRVAGAAVFLDRLYVLVLGQETGSPARPRGWLYTYDLHEEKLVGDPNVIEGAVAGGVQVLHQQLWVMWCDVTDQGATRLQLAPMIDQVIGDPFVWPDAPTASLRDPALAAFGDELLIMFSDGAPTVDRPGREPLSAVRFNGAAFRGLRKLADLGCNTQPGGAQLGPNFYLFYSTDLPWVSYGGPFRDLRLATLVSGSPALEAITYLDDMKYNIACHATVYDHSLYVVHEKLEEEPSDPAHPPYSYGTFLNRLDFGPVPAPPVRRGPPTGRRSAAGRSAPLPAPPPGP